MSVSSDLEDFEFALENAQRPITSAHQPGFGRPKSEKKVKTKLDSGQRKVVITNYWSGRPEARSDSVEGVMQWIIYAFLHFDQSRGEWRNHEIQTTRGANGLIDAMFDSASSMQQDKRWKVEMRPPCWWGVQENYHDLSENDIHMIALAVHERLIDEAIERLIAENYIVYLHDYWILFTGKSRRFIRKLDKKQGKWRAADPVAN